MQSRWRRWLIKPTLTCCSLLFLLMVIGGVFCVYLNLQLPDVSILKDMHLQVPLRVYSRDGKLMAVYGTKRRIPIAFKQIPKPMISALLAVEDARYYEHPGVDFIGILRAARAVILSGRKVQGASTITMQVARNFFLTRKKTYSRKIKEILLALKIDRELSKDKVLELYLNKVYFGNRAYGVQAAARVYYGKDLKELNLAQMAMLAGLPQAPSRNNPISNPQGALKRRNHVLSRMLEVGFIKQKQYVQAINQPITASYHGENIAFHAPYVTELVRQILWADYGAKAYESGFNVTTTIDSKLQGDAQRALEQGLIQYSLRHGYVKPSQNLGAVPVDKAPWIKELSSLENQSSLQPAAVLSLQSQSALVLLANGQQVTIPWAGLSWARPALSHGHVGPMPKTAADILNQGDVIWVNQQTNGQWCLRQQPKVQGAFIAMKPQTGSILALVGGYNYNASKFNRATQAERQPGSGFKPFIYSAAIAKGYTLASIINDAPVVMKDSGENALWRPNNDTMKFYGPTRLRVGLAKSRNLVSVRLLQDIGIPYTLNYLRRFGFNPNNLPHTLSLALGSATLTPLRLASSYAIIANGGYQVTPHFIASITDQSGKQVYAPTYGIACESCLNAQSAQQAQTLPEHMAPQVLTPQNAYIMTRAMQDVIQEGTGRAAKVLKRSDLAGKTGTTNNQVDAWFSGFNYHLLATVWVGFDNVNGKLEGLHEYGSKAALPIWIDFMKQALAHQPNDDMPVPPGIVTVRIDPSTGLLANPSQRHAIFEVFRQKYEPTQMAVLNQNNADRTDSAVSPYGPPSSTNNSDSNADPLF